MVKWFEMRNEKFRQWKLHLKINTHKCIQFFLYFPVDEDSSTIEKEEWRKWSIQKQHTLLFVRSSITAKVRENDVNSKGQH